MRRFQDPVIIIGGSLSSLGVARTLGEKGIDIYLLDEGKSFCTYSRYFKKTYTVSGMRNDCEVLKKALEKIVKGISSRVVVYPGSDLAALNLSEIKYNITDNFRFVVGDKEPLEILVNKSKFYKMLDRNKINHPITFFPEGMKDIREIGNKIDYPIFVRPSITQKFVETLGVKTKGFIAYSPKELKHYYQFATKYGIEVMIQEIIPGSPENSFQLEGYYDNHHNPKVLFARQRIRIWPTDFGNTTICVSIPLIKLEKEKTLITQFIRNINYDGLMSAEFKRDERDGNLKLLEINARPWWHCWLSGRCGADIIFSSYLDAIEEDTPYTEVHSEGIKSIYFILDLAASALMFFDGNLSLQNWLSSLNGSRQFALFKRDDLSPFIIDFANKSLQNIKDPEIARRVLKKFF